jgi:hypothetical protein
MKKDIYALYHDDEYLAMGTREELAEYLGVKPSSIAFYGSPTYRKRAKAGYIVIKVEE